MKKQTSLFALIVTTLMSCQQATEGPLLKGTAKFTEETEFFINYKSDGNILTGQMVALTPDSLGNFEFDGNLLVEASDCEVYIGDGVYGVHLEKGKTAVLNVVQTAAGKYTYSFSGDNADLCELMSSAFAAYDLYTYSAQSDDEATSDDFMQRLDKAHAIVQSKLDLLGDDSQRDYYRQLTEAMYIGTKARIIEDKADAEGKKPQDYPEYVAIINSIDPNSDVSYFSANTFLWMNNQLKSAFSDGMLAVSLESMELVDSIITNEKVRKAEAYSIGYAFFAYGDHETGKEEFWTRYCEFAKDYPEYIALFQKEFEREVLDATGTQMPDIALTRPDGTKVALSTLRGKYTYVDVWATWCGPCCKEIPHLEKLVEKMAGSSSVQFVSFSVDSDVEAWKRKLESDNPAWPQFILDAEANKTLSETLNITGIPRFFILDPDGNVLNPDAKRPSNPELEAELKAF